MRVPSRSRKTAGQASLDEAVILKAGDEFVPRRRRRSQFSHDHSAGVICDFSGFVRRGVAAEGEGEESNGGVARAGNVENLPRLGRNMMRLFASLKKHHALLAERDQQKFCAPF